MAVVAPLPWLHVEGEEEDRLVRSQVAELVLRKSESCDNVYECKARDLRIMGAACAPVPNNGQMQATL